MGRRGLARRGSCGVAAALFVISSPARAEDESSPADVEISADIAFVSDYRDRGISYSGGKPAVQAGLVLAHRSGFYAGMWGSTLDSEDPIYGNVETDFFAGWSTALGRDFSADVNLTYFHLPGAINAPGFASDGFEGNVSLSARLGILEPTIGVFYAWKQDALGGTDNIYGYLDLEAQIPDTPFVTEAHLGYNRGAFSISADRTNLDWGIGVRLNVFDGLWFGAEYAGIDGPGIRDVSDDTVLLKVQADF